ncbi:MULTISPECIES: glycosyltransferase family 4 protein [Fusobacterium]|uniref:glycosyltransferase family 4 protein n=1 Tax=Fusobacterium TaxID=848 RepID=UPI001476A1E4|nr:MULTISPECIES: glycosyltransferase family 4 protein [Fusobacterium]NME35803.1 glycosyltransferase family 4 protein [Fusobacterium sp. FSA-380-WT-3A]
MKNIWIINQHAYPPGTSNWRRHYDLSKELIKYGYNINIICGSFVHDKRTQILKRNEKFRLEEYDGIKYHILKGMSYSNSIIRIISMIEFMLRVFFYEKNIQEKPEVIYSSCPHPFNGLTGLKLSKKYRAKFLLEIRDLWPETWVAMGAMTEKNIIYKIFEYIEKLLYRKADKIIGLMPGIEAISQKNISPNKIEWISNGVDLEEFDKNYLKEPKYKFSKEKYNILYTGSIGIANALEELFEVAKELEDTNIEFHFVGDGPLKEKYIKKCFNEKINNVKFYSSVKKNEVPSLLKEADLLIIPIKKSSLYKYGLSPNKLFEYLVSRKPILISTDTKYNIIDDAKCGIVVEPENIMEIKKGILKLKNLSKNEQRNLGFNGRKYGEENFSITKLGEKLYNIIKIL